MVPPLLRSSCSIAATITLPPGPGPKVPLPIWAPSLTMMRGARTTILPAAPTAVAYRGGENAAGKGARGAGARQGEGVGGRHHDTTASPWAKGATADLGPACERQLPHIHRDVSTRPRREGPRADSGPIKIHIPAVSRRIPRASGSQTIRREEGSIRNQDIRRDPQVQPKARAIPRPCVIRKHVRAIDQQAATPEEDNPASVAARIEERTLRELQPA